MGDLEERLQRLRSFFKKQQQDAELDVEVAEHLELAVEENMRHGMSAEEARRQALIRFGGVPQAKEQNARHEVCPGSRCCCRISGSPFAPWAAT